MVGSTRRRQCSIDKLQEAVAAVRDGMTLRKVSLLYNIPRNTLCRYKAQLPTPTSPENVERTQFMSVGHPTALLVHEERIIAQNLAVLADWGCPLYNTDIRMIVRDYLLRVARKSPNLRRMCLEMTG